MTNSKKIQYNWTRRRRRRRELERYRSLESSIKVKQKYFYSIKDNWEFSQINSRKSFKNLKIENCNELILMKFDRCHSNKEKLFSKQISLVERKIQRKIFVRSLNFKRSFLFHRKDFLRDRIDLQIVLHIGSSREIRYAITRQIYERMIEIFHQAVWKDISITVSGVLSLLGHRIFDHSIVLLRHQSCGLESFI